MLAPVFGWGLGVERYWEYLIISSHLSPDSGDQQIQEL